MRGIEYPHTSASSTPTRLPSAASAAARLAVSVDLPTPPLPEPTHSTFATCASAPVRQAAPPELLLQRGLLLIGEHVEVDVHVRDPLQRRDGLRDRGLEVALDRAAGRGQRHGHIDHAVAGHVDRAHHVELDDRPPQLGVDHGLQRLAYLLFVGHGPHCGKPAIPARRAPTKKCRRSGVAPAAGRRGSYFPPAGYEAGRLSRTPRLSWAGAGEGRVSDQALDASLEPVRESPSRPGGAYAVRARRSCALCGPHAPTACGRCCRDARICVAEPGSWRCSSSS